MFSKTMFLISGVESPEALIAKIKEILPEGWRKPFAGGEKTLEELVFGPEAANTLFNQSLVPHGSAPGTLAISFDTISALSLAERMPTWIRGAIEKAVKELGGEITTKRISLL